MLNIILLWFLASLGWASNCAYVRLDLPGQPMANVAVENQGRLHTCYAHVAAQMVKAYRSQKSSLQISALDAAIGSTIRRNESSIDWGTPCDAINYLRESGGCDETLIHPSFTKDAGASLNVLNLIRYHELYQALNTTTGHEVILRSIHDYLSRELKLPADFIPPDESLIRLLENKSSAVFLKGVIGYKCGTHKLATGDISACVAQAPRPQLIDELLDRPHPQPVAVTYCSEILIQGRAFQKTCEPHVSLVIGRRLSQGHCEYLVQNSWGTDCSPYSKDWTCENGKIWLDAQTLDSSALNITYLQY